MHWTKPALMAVAVGLTLTACGGSGDTEASSAPSAESGSNATYPVTVTSCGQPLTIAKAPSRAVSTDVNMTEMMVALGLEAQMVGTFGPRSSPGIPADYTASIAKIPTLSEDYLELEPLVAAKPDVLFSGYNYGLNAAKNLTPEALSPYGISTYVLTESCAHVEKKTSVSIDNTYTDLENLGKIFGVSDRATELVTEMKQAVAGAQTAAAGKPAKKVFLYDSGEQAPFTAPGLAMPNAMIKLGGGINVFEDLKESWTEVAWEQVTATAPDCIIINDYDTPSAAEKQKFLQTSPLTKNLPAVKNNCFLTLGYDELTPGPRNAEAIAKIAAWLHPAS